MNTIRDLSLLLCKNYIKTTIQPVDKIGDHYYVKAYKSEEKVVKLTVTNGEVTFIFTLNVTYKNCERNRDKEPFYIEEDGVTIEIMDINIEHYSSVTFKGVDLVQLITILKTLADEHAQIFIQRNSAEKLEYPAYTLDTKANKRTLDILFLLSKDMVNDLDPIVFKDGIEILLSDTEKVFKQSEISEYVKGNIFQKKLYFRNFDSRSIDCRLLYTLKGQPTPLIYDMLLTIFCLTDQKKRRQHFHELRDYYYHFLKEALAKLDVDLNAILSRIKYEREVKIFIPYVKLELALRYARHILSRQPGTDSKEKLVDILNSNKKYKDTIASLIRDLYEWVLYPRLNKEDCFEIIKNLTGTNEYEDVTYQLTPLGALGGFLGEYYKVKVCIEGNSFNLFAKFVPSYAPDADMISSISEKEHFVYNIFVPELRNIDIGDISHFLPKCYFSRIADVLICEDMTELNYTRLGYREPFTYEILSVVVKQLAKMHACSLVYEEKVTEETGEITRIGDKFSHYVQEACYRQDLKPYKQIHDCCIHGTINYVLDYFPEIPNEMTMGEFKEKAKHLFELMFRKIERSDKYRNVLCHGDFWSGNILIKYTDGVPTDCVFIDFQMTRYCPPTQDLLVLLYVNSDRETRQRYMSKLIDEYYIELSSILSRHDCDINGIMAYDDYMECCDYMKSQSVCQTLLYYQSTLTRDIMLNYGKDRMIEFMMVDQKNGIDAIMENEEIKKRFKEIVEELYDICVTGQFMGKKIRSPRAKWTGESMTKALQLLTTTYDY